MINQEIFREYDIRGIADRDLTSPVIEALGRAFASYIREKGITAATVGYDARLSSPRLCDDIVRGLSSSGINVTVIGLCPTPVLYFSLFHFNPGAGVMITGSHNPAEFNGFKLCVGKETIYGEEIQRLRKIMEEARSSELVAPGKKDSEKAINYELPTTNGGFVSQKPILPDYISYVKGLFSAYRDVPLKVVLDSGNGTAGLAAPEIVRSMGCAVIELFSEPDGRFPNHHPDPTVPKNITTLIETVKKEKADLGIAFDGDSDRIGVVDESGNILWGDQLMIIFSRDILREQPGATFVSEVKCSQVMYDDIRARGGNAIMWKTGHSLIKARMKETHAAMAGEMSGHLFFADRYFGYDDAIYAGCRIIEIMQKLKKSARSSLLMASQNQEISGVSHEPGTDTLSSLLKDLPRTFNTPEIRFDCPDHIKFKVVEKAKQVFLNGHDLTEKPREVITVDGVRAIFNSGWGLIRASNTQPVLVMRFEANDPASLAAIRSMMEQKVETIIASLNPA